MLMMDNNGIRLCTNIYQLSLQELEVLRRSQRAVNDAGNDQTEKLEMMLVTQIISDNITKISCQSFIGCTY